MSKSAAVPTANPSQPQQHPYQAVKITPAVTAKAEDILRKAKVQLAIHHPFWAQIVFSRPVGLSQTLSTACIDQKGVITIGVGFLSTLTVQQCVFLLAHEACHFAFLHLFRRAFREHRKWNYAADAVINDYLISNGVGEFIEHGVHLPGSKEKTAEKVYDELPESPDGQGGGGVGEGWNDLDDGDGGSQMSDGERRMIEQQIKQELAQAVQVGKMKGNLPAGIEKLVDDIINPPTPWHILLERHMTKFIKSGITWMRPNRRLLAHGIYMPTVDRVPKMGPIAIFRDTSGSCMDDASQQHFLGHINSIIEKCRPEKVYVLDIDVAVHACHEYTLDDLPVKPAPRGGGGTSFKPPFVYCEQHGIDQEIECAVYLTDLYGDFPERAPEYDVVWLCTSNVAEVPFGEVIKYDPQADRDKR